MAGLAKFDHAQALLDLVKAFETIPHHLVVLAARDKGCAASYAYSATTE